MGTGIQPSSPMATRTPAVNALIESAAVLASGTFAAWSSELGHLVAERSMSSADAKTLRLALLRGAASLDATSVAAANAMADFIAAYEASKARAEQHAEVLNELELDARLRETLLRFRTGPLTANEIGGGHNNGKWTRILARLEELQLLEEVEARDARTKPRILTSLGQIIVSRVEQKQNHTKAQPSIDDDLVSGIVLATLRALQAVNFHSRDVPMRREELRASLHSLHLRENILEWFACFGESYGFFDIDAEGAFWHPEAAPRHAYWDNLLRQFSGNPQLSASVFAALPAGKSAVLVTIGMRMDRWRPVLGQLPIPIEPVTVELLEQTTERHDIVVVDDDTLARALAPRVISRRKASQVVTIDATVETEPKLCFLPVNIGVGR